MQRQTNDPWRSTTRVDPTARLDGRWLQMTSAASLVSSGTGGTGGTGGLQLDQASLGFVASPAPFGLFRLTTTGSVERQSISPVVQRNTGMVESALSMRVGNWGGWFGFAAEHTQELEDAGVKPLLRLGLWHQFGGVTASLSRETHSAMLSTGPTDSSRSRTYTWSNAQGQLGWSLKGVYFDTRFGMQPKVAQNKQAYWGRGSATVALNSRLSLVAEGGNQPAIAWVGTPAKRFASLGLRMSTASLVHPDASPNVRPNAASFVLQPIGHQGYVVSLRVPSARAVEISGDFNGWKALALRQARPDVWETTLTLAPGTYHMNVRVNGDNWTAPPGVPSTNDDFNGTVGLVVVR
jgi:hypothetical protein